MDEQIIKNFENKLAIFDESFKSIANDFSEKLTALATQTKDIGQNTQFLKTMKIIYEEQNKQLNLMEATIIELIARLDDLTEGEIHLKSKKKKKKK